MISKIEAVWRHLLASAQDQGQRRTSLTQLSAELGLPISTIHAALERPRSIGAVRGSAAGIRILDSRRLQLLWAARRDLQRDVVYSTRVARPVEDIEKDLPLGAIPTAFTAYVRRAGRNLVADFDQVVVYADRTEMKRRFAPRRGEPNLIVLEPDSLLAGYGQLAPQCQVYSDLFNLPSWQAQRFLEALDREWLSHVA